MAKKLSKILWHDTKVDGAGKPVLPSVATDDKGLNGLLPGELFMHVGKEKVSLWALSLSGEVVEVSGKTDEVDIDLSDYLLKSVWDSVFEIKTDGSGQKYIFGKLPVVTKYGITMYADDGNVDIPQLAEGLPFDQRTIWFNPETKQIEVIGGTGGGVADSVLWDNVEGKPSWITNTKPIYNYSEIKNTPDLSVFVTGTALSNTLADYATLTYLTGELKKYVTLDGAQDIKGVKNFVNGLKIGGMPITKMQDDVIYIDANVVVRGGVTMYSDNEVDIPSIKDEIGFAGYNGSVGLASFDSSQFVISANGTVSVKSGSTGLDTAQLKDYLDSNKYTTETWVKEQGYASASSLSSLQTKVNNFLEGSDTDTIINKWKELEVFLSGLSESDNLATILSTKWTTDNNLINQWNTAYGWGDHSKVGYALKSYVDTYFVTLGTKQPITGEKNFTGGLKVNGSPIYYDATNKYWKLEGDLLVTGGVSMYSDDSEFTPSTIMDGVVVDGTSIRKNPTTGALEVIGGSGATVKYPLTWSGFNQGSYDGSVAQSFYIPTKLSEFVNDKSFATTSDLSGYLPKSGGTMTGSIRLTNDRYLFGSVAHNTLSDKNGYLTVYNINNATVLGAFGDGTTPNIATYIRSTGDNLYHRKGNNNSYNDYKIWDAGNDGEGSGLDADLLDGYHHTSFHKYHSYSLGAGKYLKLEFGDTVDCLISFNTTLGVGSSLMYYSSYGSGTISRTRFRYIYRGSFITAYVDNSVSSRILYIKNEGSEQRASIGVTFLRTGNSCSASVVDSLPSSYTEFNNERILATLSDNVASATKLKTPRTIWGQSFDGTSNLIGTAYIGQKTNGTATIDAFNGKAYYGCDAVANGAITSTTGAYIAIDYNTGFIGVGAPNPEYKLHVFGNMRAYNVSTDSVALSTYCKTIWDNSIVINNANYFNNGASVYGNNNTCYVGDWTMRNMLHWRDGLAASGYVTGYTIGSFRRTSSFGGIFIAVSNSDGLNSVGASMEIEGNGVIGINAPNYLSTSNNLLVAGGITMYSDIRKKTKLQDVELSLSQIANAPLIEHYYNSDQDKTTHVGSIAQYWAEINDWFCKKDAEGFYTMEIQNCALASVISVARHLEKYESKTDKKIRMLKKRIQELEDKVERLKKGE